MNHWDTVKKVRGIYKVTNKINGKVYIGQSVDIGRRWCEHMNAKDDIYFHKAIQKYGVDNFIWEVIEKCKKSELDERESYWIEYYDSFNKGYNCTKGGDVGPVMHGEDNPNWKGGISLDRSEYNKQYNKQYSKQWYETNKDKIKEKAKEYRESNKDKIKEYREANKEELKKKQKEYREANKEKMKEKMKEYAKQYYEENKDKIKEKTKEYYEINKEKMKEYRRQRNKKSMKKNTLFNQKP